MYVLNTHPIQYYAPIWRQLSRRADLNVEVLYGADFSVRGYRDREFGKTFRWDVDLLAGYRSRFLPGAGRVRAFSFFRPSPRPVFRFLMTAPKGVVVGTAYHALFWYGAYLAALLRGHRIVLRHDATDAQTYGRGIKARLRDAWLRALYRRVAAFAVVGRVARRHLRRLGVPENKMVASPFCVDSGWVRSQISAWRPRRNEIRKSLGVARGQRVLLFCGKLIPQKEPLLLVRALELLPARQRSRIHLLVAGDGSLRQEMAAAARRVVGPRCHFLSFLNQRELGRAYACADLLVLPSRSETWGLVVNEALQWGIPAVVTDRVGCAEDLVKPGKTGEIFPAGSPEALARAISRLFAGWRKQSPTRACQKAAATHALPVAVAGLARAIQKAASG